LGNRFGEGWALHMTGLVDIWEQRTDDADRRFRRAWELFRQADDKSANVLLLLDFAFVAQQRGDLERYWTLAGASKGQSQRTGIMLAGSVEDFVDLAAPERPDEDPDGRRAWDAGLKLDMDEAVELALGEPRSRA
jgi:hypothetical protein